MEYYCVMVRTGEESSFKESAQKLTGKEFPDAQYFFFKKTLKTNKGKYFESPLFPGYVFLKLNEFSIEFFELIKKASGFCRILASNTNPVRIIGQALDELKIFINNGESLGISKVVFLPGKKVKAISGPLAGLEGNIYMVNKKKHHITVISSLSPTGKKFDLLYEEAELIEEKHEDEKS